MSELLGYELLKELAVLGKGRAPVLRPQGWTFQGQGTPPQYASSGVDVTDVLFAQVGVRLRSDPLLWKGWLRIDTFDAGKFFGATCVPNSESYKLCQVVQGVVDISTTLAALKVDADADVTFQAYGISTEILAAPNDSILQYSFTQQCPVRLDDADDGGNAQTSPPFQSVACEASQCFWRLWGLEKTHSMWIPIGQYMSFGVNDLRMVDCARFNRLYVEVVRADGEVLPFVGPCVKEGLEETLREAAVIELALAEAALFNFPTSSLGSAPDHHTAAESDPVGSLDGIDVEGLTGVAVYVTAPQTTTSFTVRIDLYDGFGWSYASGGEYTVVGAPSNPWCERFDIRNAKRFSATITDVIGVPGSSVERSYIEVV